MTFWEDKDVVPLAQNNSLEDTPDIASMSSIVTRNNLGNNFIVTGPDGATVSSQRLSVDALQIREAYNGYITRKKIRGAHHRVSLFFSPRYFRRSAFV